MIEIKAPENYTRYKHQIPFTIFLSGSIEMGKAVNWQKEVCNYLKNKDVLILNPRRDDWDGSWVQSIENKEFYKQVRWEITGQEQADLIFMYFSPETKAPITLLELGMFANSKKIIVICPDGFYRKGNVDVVCEHYKILLFNSLDKALIHLKQNYF